MRGDGFNSFVEVGFVIGAKKKAAPLPCPRSQLTKKLRLEEPVLVMAFLRPGVGEEHINIKQPDADGQFMEKITRLATEELQITQACAIPLVQRLHDPLETQVDPHAELVGVRGGIGNKEVAVAAADLKHETRPRCRQYRRDLGAQGGETTGMDGLEHFAWHGNVKG